jgi:predicted nucleotidyltransferase
MRDAMGQANTISEQLRDEIVRRICDTADVGRIVLFGSAATGEMNRDSDIDLLVLENEPGDVRQEMRRLRAELRGLGVPFDVLVMSKKRFEETKNVIGGIAYPANKYGCVIYDAF